MKNFSILLKKILPIVSYQFFNKEVIVTTLIPFLNITLKILKNHINFQYKVLSCVSGVDLIEKSYRFCIVYDLLSLLNNTRIRVKVFTNSVVPLISATKIFINANWWEREIWDMFGVFFDSHGDLRRLLTDYGFEGHPLRKDFPLFGFFELRYNENKKRVVSEPLQLSQEMRNFVFESPWINL